MVKVTTNYLIRRIIFRKQLQVRKKDETDKQFLNRITHLRLQGQFIDQIAKITDCQSVLVIYLQNNLLRTIHNMGNFPNLIHLYLQRNLLSKIENLDVLTKLKKLYLGYNEILVLEGLENLNNVVEIHIESQNLPLGETLYFEPRTIKNLGLTLQVLNVSNNNLTTLSGLQFLASLQILTANDNFLEDLEDLTNTLQAWPLLKELSLIGNPITEDRKYRDSVIFFSKRLVVLDNKAIQENTRKFIEKLIRLREFQRGRDLEEEEEEEKEKERIVKFKSRIPSNDNFPSLEDFEVPIPSDLHPAWRLRKNVNPVNPTTFLPRPYWRKSNKPPANKSSVAIDISAFEDL